MMGKGACRSVLCLTRISLCAIQESADLDVRHRRGSGGVISHNEGSEALVMLDEVSFQSSRGEASRVTKEEIKHKETIK